MGEPGRGRAGRRLAVVGLPAVVVVGIVVGIVVLAFQSDDDEQVRTGPASGTTPETTVTTPVDTGRPGRRVQVKFVDGSGVRLRDNGLVSQTGHDLAAFGEVLARYPGTGVERLFQRPEEDLAAEKAASEARSGEPQPDLNLYFRLTLVEGIDATALIADLGGLPVVELANVDPVAAPPPAAAP